MEEAIHGILRQVIEEILEVAPVRDHEDFFELGGDSVTALMVAIEAEKKGIPLPRNAVLLNPTLDELVPFAVARTPRQTFDNATE